MLTLLFISLPEKSKYFSDLFLYVVFFQFHVKFNKALALFKNVAFLTGHIRANDIENIMMIDNIIEGDKSVQGYVHP